MLYKFKNKLNKQSGFTLLEILLVVGIIAILAGIVIVAINPNKQLASVRNAQRKSDLKQLDSAITQYYIDNFSYPSDITTTLTEICDTGSAAATTTALDGTACTNLVNLSDLVPDYITAIPKDPQGPITVLLNKITTPVYAAVGGNGYKVMKDTGSGRLGFDATNAELGQAITLGVSTSTGDTPEVVYDWDNAVLTGTTINVNNPYWGQATGVYNYVGVVSYTATNQYDEFVSAGSGYRWMYNGDGREYSILIDTETFSVITGYFDGRYFPTDHIMSWGTGTITGYLTAWDVGVTPDYTAVWGTAPANW